MRETSTAPWFWALLAACLVLLWQSATVWANYQGNWTALFCTGALQRIPPALQGESIYTFPNSYGYDGQFYHYIAHDPFLRRDLSQYIDEPGIRYRRILVPLLAWLAAGGRDGLVHLGFYSVILASIFLGTYWLSGCAREGGRHCGWGLLFLATPAALISADRMIVDGTLTALTVAFVVWSERRFSGRLWLVLAAAALTRETGVLLAMAAGLTALFRRQPRSTLLAASAAVPCAAWYLFVQAHTRAFSYFPSHVPFSSILYAISHPTTYPASIPFTGMVQMGDLVAVAGALVAIILGAVRWRSWLRSAPGLAALLFIVLGAFVQRDEVWIHLGRLLSPLLIILVCEWMRGGRALLLAPLALMLPRVLLQMGSQMLGVLRAFAAHL